MTTVLNPPAPATAPVVVEAVDRRSTIGYVALGLAIVGFVLAVLAITAGLAWLLLVPAIILGVIGLFLPHRTKGAALAGVIIAVVSLILSFVGLRLPTELVGATGPLNNSGGFSSGLFAGGNGTAGGATGSTGGAGTSGTGTDAQDPTIGAEVAVAGTTVTAAVNGVDCGLPLVGVDGLNVSTDVLCAVHVSVANDSGQPVDISSANVSVTSNGTPLTVDANVGDAINAQVATGSSTSGIVYVRVPAGTTSLDGLDVHLN